MKSEVPVKNCSNTVSFRIHDKEYDCPVQLALSVMGGKWKGLILFMLMQHGTLRYSELRNGLPDVTHKMLTQQLRELENDGIVHREVYPVVPPKVEYSLTEVGLQLGPVLDSMRDWGVQFKYPKAESA
jgi:DNA-binding HxlR family transcriptional regulator